MTTPLPLDEAVALTRTGDLWLFRGRSRADRAIQTVTNAPVNHVGMAVVLDDLPPLMWHAELGRSLTDVWTGTRHRGVQLHDLRDAATVWCTKYQQRAWLRQFDGTVTEPMEAALLETIARLDGLPFPSTAKLAGKWVSGRLPRRPPSWETIRALPATLRDLVRPARGADPSAGDPVAGAEDGDRAGGDVTYCAEVVAATYQAMGLLDHRRGPEWYDPGKFWSGDGLQLLDARLGPEISVTVPRV